MTKKTYFNRISLYRIMVKSGYFISIGAGKNQLPFILKLKELGFRVIAVDQNSNAVGFAHSEIKIIQSILDYRKIYAAILKLYLDEPIIGIGVRSYGKAVLTASYIAKNLQLIGDDWQVLEKFYNKKTMKTYLGENEILVPRSYSWQNSKSVSKFLQSISFPCILKPIDTVAKLGIEIFVTPETLQKRLSQIKNQDNLFLLEEFIEGYEVTVLGFVQNGKFQLVSISDKVTTSYPPFLEISHRLPTTQIKSLGELKLICQNIVSLTGLENSPLVAEFKITPRGEIYLIEVMPEIGGEYIADHLIKEFYSYDYFKNYVQLLLGNPISPVESNSKKKKERISQICFIAPPEGESKFVSNKQVNELNGKIFLNEKLKLIGESLNTKAGNSCRVQVIGVSTSNIKNPDELDSIIRKQYNAKFE